MKHSDTDNKKWSKKETSSSDAVAFDGSLVTEEEEEEEEQNEVTIAVPSFVARGRNAPREEKETPIAEELVGGDDALVNKIEARARDARREEDKRDSPLEEEETYEKQFKMLLSRAIQDHAVSDKFTLLLPTFILEDIGTCVPFFASSKLQEDNDMGWMYRPIIPQSEQAKLGVPNLNETIPHLIWPSDSF